jgi:hypothetical protein
MSAFTPTVSNLEPPDSPDNLSLAVLHSLSRPIYGRVAWGPVKSFFLGAISFGILPLLAWPRAFARFAAAEQQQYWHLLEWLHIRTGDKDAAMLRDHIRTATVPPTISFVPIILVAIVLINFLPAFNIDHFFRDTYGLAPFFDPRIFNDAWTHTFKVWTICLSIGYISHWIHVRQYVFGINQTLQRLNIILVRQQLPPVPKYEVGLGLRRAWLIGGLLGLAGGAIWAIPAAAAGGIHERYCRRTSTRIRGELASRVNLALSRQRPPIDVPIPNGFRVTCRNQLCRKPLAPGASFCSRCGTRVPSADSIA